MQKFLTLEGLKTFWGKIKERFSSLNESIYTLNEAIQEKIQDLEIIPNISGYSIRSSYNGQSYSNIAEIDLGSGLAISNQGITNTSMLEGNIQLLFEENPGYYPYPNAISKNQQYQYIGRCSIEPHQKISIDNSGHLEIEDSTDFISVNSPNVTQLENTTNIAKHIFIYSDSQNSTVQINYTDYLDEKYLAKTEANNKFCTLDVNPNNLNNIEENQIVVFSDETNYKYEPQFAMSVEESGRKQSSVVGNYYLGAAWYISE